MVKGEGGKKRSHAQHVAGPRSRTGRGADQPVSMHRSGTALREDHNQQDPSFYSGLTTAVLVTRSRDVVSGARGNGASMFSVTLTWVKATQKQMAPPVMQTGRSTNAWHGREVLTDRQHSAQQEARDFDTKALKRVECV